MSWHDRTL